MADELIDVSPEWAKRAYVDEAKYEAMYEASIADPASSGASTASALDWIKPFTQVKDVAFDEADFRIRWFDDGALNVSRQLPRPPPRQARRPDRDHLGRRRPGRLRRTSPTASCTTEVCRFANVLKAQGVKKGDRVTIYLPMIPEAAFAMLACARIGAVHSVVFGGFSPDSLAGRIQDCDCDARHHRRRRPARRQDGAAEGQCRRGAEAVPRRRRRDRGHAAPAATCR